MTTLGETVASIGPSVEDRVSRLLRAVTPRLRQVAVPLKGRSIGYVLFFSVSDGRSRATVIRTQGTSLTEAWRNGWIQLRRLVRERGMDVRWLRVDHVDAIRETNWGMLRTLLATAKRNYFRSGLSLDARCRFAFLETELNANAMLYGGPKVPTCVVNEANFQRYARLRHGLKSVDMADFAPVWLFSSRGLFVSADAPDKVEVLNGPGLEAGHRALVQLGPAAVGKAIATGSAYLARQVGEDGRFVYGWHPCFDRPINAYNCLRHASTTYSMLEAWEVTREDALLEAIERSLGWLRREAVREVRLPDGTAAAFLVDVDDEVKLGGNAVAILAMAKYAALTGSDEDAQRLERLALGIRHMQKRDDGSFVHVLHFPDLSVKAAFRTIYYEGEAAFALMRLYELTGDGRWLEMVERAFDHFIAREHWRHHDHWLSYCVNELTRYRPEERYFRFGIANIRDHLDFVLERVTTFPTLLELMMAGQAMLDRMDAVETLRFLSEGLDREKFMRALHHRAYYLFNGYFWPELAMFFKNPDRIVGSFFIRHQGFRVRIDDVEHYLSGLIAYRAFLLKGPEPHPFRRRPPDKKPAAAPDASLPGWTAGDLVRATGGSWLASPEEGWCAAGLAIHAPACRAGDMVAVRSGREGSRGVTPQALKALLESDRKPGGLLVENRGDAAGTDRPALLVPDTGAAILDMGRFARAHMTGRIIAVTGSAGKTSTVAMLARALSPWGDVGRTAFNANLPHGVAWNLASIPRSVPHAVMELAIGKMAQSARLARPHVAVFTNILPAHLGETATLADIARTKSAIFLGMEPGNVAVLNRDMSEWETVRRAAEARQLKILTYGRHEDSAYRLSDYEGGVVRAETLDGAIRYHLGAMGEHMALNSLAILAVVRSLGHELAPALQQLEGFEALPGRGETLHLCFGARRLTVIDDAYNANPGSMRAALAVLAEKRDVPRRVAVLGEMADLGPAGRSFHDALACFPDVEKIDRIHVVGDLYRGFWQALSEKRRGIYAASPEEMAQALETDLKDGDCVLIKGSHSTNMHKLVEWLKAGSDET